MFLLTRNGQPICNPYFKLCSTKLGNANLKYKILAWTYNQQRVDLMNKFGTHICFSYYYVIMIKWPVKHCIVDQ